MPDLPPEVESALADVKVAAQNLEDAIKVAVDAVEMAVLDALEAKLDEDDVP